MLDIIPTTSSTSAHELGNICLNSLTRTCLWMNLDLKTGPRTYQREGMGSLIQSVQENHEPGEEQYTDNIAEISGTRLRAAVPFMANLLECTEASPEGFRSGLEGYQEVGGSLRNRGISAVATSRPLSTCQYTLYAQRTWIPNKYFDKATIQTLQGSPSPSLVWTCYP